MRTIVLLMLCAVASAQPRKMTTEEQLQLSKAAAAEYRARAMLNSKIAGCPTWNEIQTTNQEVELRKKVYQETLDAVRAAAKASKDCEPDGDGGWVCKAK